MGKIDRRTAIAVMAAGAAAIGGGYALAQGESDGRISGSVLYRERMMLPPDARVTVSLLDISRADAPAEVLGQTEITGKTASPIAYELNYDPSRIQPRHRYALQARITVGDKLLFINTSSHPAVFDKTGPQDILVTRVGRESGTLTGTWIAEDIAGGGVMDNLQSSLTIESDGSVSGMAGCNRYTGHAEIEGQTMSFGALAATSRMCLDAPMNQERKFFAALEKVRAYRIQSEGQLLFLLDEAGETAMRLARGEG